MVCTVLLAVFAVFAGKKQRTLTYTPQKLRADEFSARKITAGTVSLPRCIEAKTNPGGGGTAARHR
jgi:hypothetical protein